MTPSDRNELIDYWKDAIDNGTFLTSKHDPNSVGTPHPRYRTVTVKDSAELKTFLEGGDFKVRQFQNNNPNHTDGYYQVIPNDSSMVAGSGVQPHSPTCSHPCDSFVAVSGVNQGWHLFAEESANIQQKETNGDLTFITEL